MSVSKPPRRNPASMGLSQEDELFLYVIHGTLHLVGFDDQDDDSRREMRTQEARYLRAAGIPIAPTNSQ